MSRPISSFAEIAALTPEEAAAFQKVMLEALEKTNAYTLAGVGTFTRRGHTIRFEADPAFALEINAPYAGLHPLLLVKMGPHLVGNSDAAFPLPAQASSAPVDDEAPVLPHFPPPEPVFEMTGVGAVTQLREEETQAIAAASDNAAAEHKTPVFSTGSPAADLPKSASTTRRLAGIFTVIAAAAAVVLWFILQPVPVAPVVELPVPKDAVTANTVVDTTAPGLSHPDSTGITAAGSTQPADSDTVVTSDVSAPSSQPEPTAISYGLMLPADTSINDFYALVVHSLDKSEKADAQRALFEQSGFRVSIQQVTVDEKQTWRVGLGQFATIDDAKSASANLPEKLRTRYFIKRFTF
jgi:cell division septation protein DedD